MLFDTVVVKDGRFVAKDEDSILNTVSKPLTNVTKDNEPLKTKIGDLIKFRDAAKKMGFAGDQYQSEIEKLTKDADIQIVEKMTGRDGQVYVIKTRADHPNRFYVETAQGGLISVESNLEDARREITGDSKIKDGMTESDKRGLRESIAKLEGRRSQAKAEGKENYLNSEIARMKKALEEPTDRLLQSYDSKTKDEGVQFQCNECGKIFSKNLKSAFDDVKCPKCGGYDVEPTGLFGDSKTKDTSYKVEVLAVGETNYASNGLRFSTPEKAKEYGENLLDRWSGAKEFKVTETSDPITRDHNYFEKGQKVTAAKDTQGLTSGSVYTVVGVEEVIKNSAETGAKNVIYKLLDASGKEFYVSEEPVPLFSTQDSDWNAKLDLKSQIAGLNSQISNATVSRSIGTNISQSDIDAMVKERKALEEKLKSMFSDAKDEEDVYSVDEDDIFKKRQIEIAKKTLNMPDAMVAVAGGPSKAEAREILKKFGIKTSEDSAPRLAVLKKNRDSARKMGYDAEPYEKEIAKIIKDQEITITIKTEETPAEPVAPVEEIIPEKEEIIEEAPAEETVVGTSEEISGSDLDYKEYSVKQDKETGEFDIISSGGSIVGHTKTIELAKIFIDGVTVEG